jgi:hypothetical protein
MQFHTVPTPDYLVTGAGTFVWWLDADGLSGLNGSTFLVNINDCMNIPLSNELGGYGGFPVIATEADGSSLACNAHCWGFYIVALPRSTEWPRFFVRGDANEDGYTDVSDAISIIGYLLGYHDSSCADALDTNDDGKLDAADPVFLLNSLFLGTGPPSTPAFCWIDTTDDELSCSGSAYCNGIFSVVASPPE